MRTRILVVVAIISFIIGFGWYARAQQSAALSPFMPGQVLTAAALNTIVEQAEAHTGALTGGTVAAPIQVNCNAGESLGRAVQRALPGRTIRVNGTCTESVTITTDRLTLDGQGTAVLDGGDPTTPNVAEVAGVLTIAGARGVTITGFTVQNGHDGIVATGGASFAVRNTTVQDHTVTGIHVENNSTVEIADCTARRNGTGIEVSKSASALFRGTIRSTDNAMDGIFIGASFGEFRGATVEANNNGRAGITGAGDGATILTSGRRGDAPSSLTTNGNRAHGIFLFGAVQLQTGGSRSTITAANNGNGLFLIGNAVVINNPAPGNPGTTFLIENNTTGVNLDVQSTFFVIGGLTARNNTTGLLANGADTVTVATIPPNPSTITGNRTTDVDLRFGTRSTFNGVTIGTFTCDDTVPSRGTRVCP